MVSPTTGWRVAVLTGRKTWPRSGTPRGLNVTAVNWMMQLDGRPSWTPPPESCRRAGPRASPSPTTPRDYAATPGRPRSLLQQRTPWRWAQGALVPHGFRRPEHRRLGHARRLGTVLLAEVGTDTLLVSNAGCEVLQVISISVDNPVFTVDPTPFHLDPGQSPYSWSRPRLSWSDPRSAHSHWSATTRSSRRSTWL